MKRGLREGETWPDGWRYEGGFRRGEPHGRGVQTRPGRNRLDRALPRNAIEAIRSGPRERYRCG